MNKCVLALSGGLDSTVLLHKAHEMYDHVHCVFFDYGQRHRRERDCAHDQVNIVNQKAFKADLIEVRLPLRSLCPVSSLTSDDVETPDVRDMLGEAQPKSYVPFRNMIILSLLLSYAEATQSGTVWYGAAEVDSVAGYWDGTQDFVDRINDVATLNREHQIKVEAPLLTMSKKAIIEEGIRLKIDFGKTWTCYSGDELADPYSPSSSSRLQGFAQAGYIDPIKYNKDLSGMWKSYNCKEIVYG